MTTTEERLEAVLARLEAMAPEVGLQAATNPDGTPANVAAGELVEAAWGNAVVANLKALPQGLIGYIERPTSAGAITEGQSTPVAGLTVPVTITESRHLRLEAWCRHIQSDTDGGYGAFQIRNAANAISAEGLYVAKAAVGSVFLAGSLFAARNVVLPAGTHTFTVWGNAIAGTMTLSATATAPITLAIYDFGAP